jgi:hypothetical protein
MTAGLMVSTINPVMGLSMMMMGGMFSLMGNGMMMQRMMNFGGGDIAGLMGGTLAGGLLGGVMGASISNAFRPQNVKQKAEQALTQLAQYIINGQGNPQIEVYKQILKQVYIQIAQRIDISPEVRQLVSQAIGSDVANVSPSVNGLNGLNSFNNLNRLANASINIHSLGPSGLGVNATFSNIQNLSSLGSINSSIISILNSGGLNVGILNFQGNMGVLV